MWKNWNKSISRVIFYWWSHPLHIFIIHLSIKFLILIPIRPRVLALWNANLVCPCARTFFHTTHEYPCNTSFCFNFPTRITDTFSPPDSRVNCTGTIPVILRPKERGTEFPYFHFFHCLFWKATWPVIGRSVGKSPLPLRPAEG